MSGNTLKLRAAVLIVSDTAFRDPSSDKSAAVLQEVLADDGNNQWSEEVETKIVPDDAHEIQKSLFLWTDYGDSMNLVVTTGGTGFARKDYTPEAVSPLLHRHAPGLVHAMLSASFQVTPFAMMSRPVAGVRHKTILLTLPGSPKGAKENLQAVLKLLPHACVQAAGGDSRSLHAGGVKKLETDAGVTSAAANGTKGQSHSHDHSHSHSHDHGHSHSHKAPKAHTDLSERPQPQSNDPSSSVTLRHRSSPYPMLSVTDAVSTILDVCPAPIPTNIPFSTSLVGSIISENVHALEAVPAYPASIVDGYAVIVPPKSSEKAIKGVFPVASVSVAQASSMPPPLKEDGSEIARITTGAPLPPNANAVVMVEDTAISATRQTDDGKTEEDKVEILTDELTEGENVREEGSDIALESLVLPAGSRISPLGGELGVLAASGQRNVPIYKKPTVGILSTGDEVTDISHDGKLFGGMIRDSNRPSLLSLVSSWNLCEKVIDCGIARDTPHSELEASIRRAFGTQNCDVLVTTGGVSMGELDLLKPTIERSMGGTVHFGRVSMKPGKPTTFASVEVKGAESGEMRRKLVFGLPGNPASALVTANLFLLPALQRMAGMKEEDAKGLERVMVTVKEKVKCDKARVEYHRVVVAVEVVDGKSTLVARSTGMQRSSRVGSLATANALLVLPQKEGFVEANGSCEALMMGPLLGL